MSLLHKFSLVLLSCLLTFNSAANIKTRQIDFEDCGEFKRFVRREFKVLNESIVKMSLDS